MNITSLLSQVMSKREALRAAESTVPGADVDWDEGAGESWARAVVGEDAVALLWMAGGFAIVLDSAELEKELKQLGWAVVSVDSMTEPVFSAAIEELRRFAGREPSEGFDPESFSAEDLVWTSV